MDIYNIISNNINSESDKYKIIKSILGKGENTGLCNNGMNETPVWFNMFCEFNDKKEELIHLFDALNVNYKTWIKDFRLPYQWNSEEVGEFVKDLGNQYVCNSCIFSDNLGFWYEISQSTLLNPSSNIHTNYSQIPWQFVLKNKLIVSDHFSSVIDEIKKGKRHSYYFSKITSYQELSFDNIDLLIGAYIHSHNKGHYPHESWKACIKDLIPFLSDSSKHWDFVIDEKIYLGSIKMPNRALKRKIRLMSDNHERLGKMLSNKDLFSADELEECIRDNINA